MLSILLTTATLVTSQTVWTGNSSSNWLDELNWSNGLPSPINQGGIPSEPTGNFLPIITEDINIDYALTNANILTLFANVTISGSITNFEDGSIINNGILENLMTFDNDGSLYSSNDIFNHGEINNSGIIQFDFGDELINYEDGELYNFGPIKLTETYFQNLGTIYLNGDVFECNGIFENMGTIYNNGTIENKECGIFKNFGTLDNQFIIRNLNVFYNFGDLTGNPIIDELNLQNTPGLTIVNHECTDLDGWTHYSDSTQGKIVLSIFTDDQDIGSILDQTLTIQLNNDPRLGTGEVDNLNDALYKDCDDWYLLNRSWMIRSDLVDNIPFKVRFYFQESEYQDIKNTFPLSQTIEELFFFKLQGTEDAYDRSVLPSDVAFYQPDGQSSFDSWYQDKISAADYCEIEVNGLNGAYSAGVKSWLGGTIPNHISFTAVPNNQNQSVDLSWSTSSELNTQEYIIERSEDGFNFSDFSSLPAAGITTDISNYQNTDLSPNITGTTYYRLKLIMTNGSTRYSIIKEVNFQAGEILLFPNPSSEELYIRFVDMEEGAVNIRIYDIDGQMRMADQFVVSNSILVDNIYSKVNLGAGVYTLVIERPSKDKTFRFLKVAR